MTQDLAIYTKDLATSIIDEISNINIDFIANSSVEIPHKKDLTQIKKNNIYLALAKLSTSLGNSYAQILLDIDDEYRLSWAGTAHEIRQLLSSLLEILAPDDEVLKQDWFIQDSQTKGPTQKQRVRYILILNNSGSKEQNVVENVTNMDEWISNLVRSTYSRASDAAHRFKPRNEAIKILRYFEAFAQDLLNI